MTLKLQRYVIMNLKHDESEPSSNGKNYESPIESCDHLISTSLRDLSKKYEDLSQGQSNAGDVNSRTKIGQGRKLE